MKQEAVEKPGWRQPTPPRFSIFDFGDWIGELRFPILLILLLGTTGWAQSGDQLPPPPPASPPTLITSGSGYRLHQGDKIEVRFFYQPELNQEAVVKPDGTVSLQLIGDVPAVGLTPQQLEQQLTKQYAKSLVDPVISVVLKEYVKPRIFVGGQVAKPGAYELRDGDTLAQVLFLAGGFTPQAHRKMVIHARPVGEGQLRVTVIDTTKLYARNPDPDLNLTLKDGDLVYVPESRLSRVSAILAALRVQTFGLFIDPFRR